MENTPELYGVTPTAGLPGNIIFFNSIKNIDIQSCKEAVYKTPGGGPKK